MVVAPLFFALQPIYRTKIKRQLKMFYFCSTKGIARQVADKSLVQSRKTLKFRKSGLARSWSDFWYKNRATFPEFRRFATCRAIPKETVAPRAYSRKNEKPPKRRLTDFCEILQSRSLLKKETKR
ncbi:MAG: hypothetical protein J0L53_10555 [Spirochaetes bacterium]|nr:hypothetical protein [Spirochaetota bacterium]